MDIGKDAKELIERFRMESLGIVVNDIQEPIYLKPPSSWQELLENRSVTISPNFTEEYTGEYDKAKTESSTVSPSSVIKPSKPKAYPVTPTADPEWREKRLASLPLFVAKDDLIYKLQGNTYRSLRKDLSFLATTVKDLQANGFYFPTEEEVTRWINFHLQVQPGCMNATSYYIDPSGREKISDELEKKLKKWESLPLWVEEDLVPPLGADPLYYIKMAEQNGRP